MEKKGSWKGSQKNIICSFFVWRVITNNIFLIVYTKIPIVQFKKLSFGHAIYFFFFISSICSPRQLVKRLGGFFFGYLNILFVSLFVWVFLIIYSIILFFVYCSPYLLLSQRITATLEEGVGRGGWNLFELPIQSLSKI